MKFKKVLSQPKLRVQDLADSFDGVYLGKEKGQFGFDYRFFSKDRVIVIFGVQALHQGMSGVNPGHAVKLTYLGEKRSGDHTYHDVEVLVSEEPVPGFDVSTYSPDLSEAEGIL